MLRRGGLLVIDIVPGDPAEHSDEPHARRRRASGLNQMARPIVSPATTAMRPSSTEPPRFAIAVVYDPSSMSTHDSSMNVENVVYAPMKPIITGPRMSAGRMARSAVTANSRPSTNDPLRLTARVPHGNGPAVRSVTQPPTR